MPQISVEVVRLLLDDLDEHVGSDGIVNPGMWGRFPFRTPRAHPDAIGAPRGVLEDA